MRKIVTIVVLGLVILGFCLATMQCNTPKKLQHPITYFATSDDTTQSHRINVMSFMPHYQTHNEWFDMDTIYGTKMPLQRATPITAPNPIKCSLIDLEPNLKRRPTNTINIVFMSDGFVTTADSINFLAACYSYIPGFRTRAPYSWYPKHYKFYAIFAKSKDNIIPNVATACGPLTTGNPYFGSYFGKGGTCRLITCNNTTVNNVLAGTMPYADMPVVVCNTTQYGGGADGSTAIVTLNSATIEVAIHESGHALFGLGDEYTYGGCGGVEEWNATQDTGVNCRFNDTHASFLAWFKRVNEGANYCPKTWYKDTLAGKCQMDVLGNNFCPQCKKMGIRAFNFFVNPIDSAYPAATATQTDRISVVLVQPLYNTIQTKWAAYVGGVLKYSQTGGSEFTTLPAGIYSKISVTAYDTSKWLFSLKANQYSVSWANITVKPEVVPPPPPPPKVDSTIPVLTIPATQVYGGKTITNPDNYRTTFTWNIIPKPNGVVTVFYDIETSTDGITWGAPAPVAFGNTVNFVTIPKFKTKTKYYAHIRSSYWNGLAKPSLPNAWSKPITFTTK